MVQIWMLSDEWLSRYELDIKNIKLNAVWRGHGWPGRLQQLSLYFVQTKCMFYCLMQTIYYEHYFYIFNRQYYEILHMPFNSDPSNAPVQPLNSQKMMCLFVWNFFQFANSKGSGKTAWMRRLTWAFAVGLCDKYPFLLNWLIFTCH